MITLSKLIGRPVLGDTAGRCAFCGEQTERGHKLVLKEKFMMYKALCYGDCVFSRTKKAYYAGFSTERD